jgi:signal transduction histidine kinase/integral membrane sensor domain MASE1
MKRPLTVVGMVCGVCLGYYLGSVLGIMLRLPPATPSVMWPPNSILTAVLLLVPPKRWPVVLLAALPAHLIVELQTEWPLALVLTLFLTNCSEAILVAGPIWILNDKPRQLDTPYRLAVFFVAVIVASVLSSFADAAAVRWFVGESYWSVWRNRTFSSVLTEVTIVPAIVGLVTGLPRSLRTVPSVRLVEAGLVAAGLLATVYSDFRSELAVLPPLRAVVSQTPLALQLPFLLWAAVRFGTAGAGVTLFATVVFAVWSAVHGHGPFAALSPGATVPALTLSLIVVAFTLLSLAALVDERRQTQQALATRLRFEELLSRLSGAFVQVPSDQMDAGFDEWLARIGFFLEIKCVRLYTLTPHNELTSAYEWTHPMFTPHAPPVATRDFPWTVTRLLELEPVAVQSIDEVPEGVEDRRSMRSHGYEAMLILPLVAGHRVLGALAFGAAQRRTWPPEIIRNLRLTAEVLANALARKQTEDALRASEVMKTSILRSLRSGVAVVDRDANIVAVNDSWRRLALEGNCVDVRVGDNLVRASTASAEASAATSPRFTDVAAGVTSVLDGSRDRFICEYTTQSGAEPRWWSVVIVPLDRPQGGAVVTHADITELRRAELDAQRSRQELAHVGRVSTVGELTASLAHELNQPLAAIMTNAQAARRLLGSDPPDLPQVKAILSDIVNDDRRASDVIQRLRALLRKGELEMVRVDLGSTIRDVAQLLSSEAILKQISVSLDLERDPVFVLGDRVQLQQVMLNLLHNAMEAVSDLGPRDGAVTVSCHRVNGDARVSVSDSGPGILHGSEELVFEPFYTTKRDGMGMGLSIVRSIVESHGGAIRAGNLVQRGAVFEFTLPLASQHLMDRDRRLH